MRRAMMVTLSFLAGSAALCACSGATSDTGAHVAGAGAGVAGSSAGSAGSGATSGSGGSAGLGAAGVGTAGTANAGMGGAAMGGAGMGAGGTAAAGSGGMGGTFIPGTSAMMNKGWLYTKGNQILVSNGPTAAGTRWIGRGVNVDDLFFCGYNNMLGVADAEALLKTELNGLLSTWKPNFLRISLAMNSFPVKASWLTADAKYKAPMTRLVQTISSHPNTYVMVTVRSDVTMVGTDPGNVEATGVPSDATTSPDKTLYPTGTDAVYTALVDSFSADPHVMFGLTNEAGGNVGTEANIRAAMSHAVSTIRAEEDKLGVPHHLVSVQGLGYTSNVSMYGKQPLTQDNVIYEVHAYPPSVASYTFDNIPVILGEYGALDTTTGPAFYQDIETKQISNLAWDFDPYSNCYPDLVNVTGDASKLTASDWGKLVQSYLTSHAAP